jgi:hypothetical protein
MFSVGRKLTNIRSSAKRRKIPFNLSIIDLQKQWEQQKGVCAISKIPFGIDKDEKPSVDRIDSMKGYEPQNIQFVQLWVNRAKGQASDQEIMDRIKKVK